MAGVLTIRNRMSPGGMQAIPAAADDDQQQKSGLQHMSISSPASGAATDRCPGQGAVPQRQPQSEPSLVVAPEFGHRGPSLSFNRQSDQS